MVKKVEFFLWFSIETCKSTPELRMFLVVVCMFGCCKFFLHDCVVFLKAVETKMIKDQPRGCETFLAEARDKNACMKLILRAFILLFSLQEEKLAENE